MGSGVGRWMGGSVPTGGNRCVAPVRSKLIWRQGPECTSWTRFTFFCLLKSEYTVQLCGFFCVIVGIRLQFTAKYVGTIGTISLWREGKGLPWLKRNNNSRKSIWVALTQFNGETTATSYQNSGGIKSQLKPIFSSKTLGIREDLRPCPFLAN